MRTSILILILATLFLVAPNSHAVWGWMRGAVIGDYTDADWEILKQKARSTLDSAADGEQVNWRNDDTGNKGAFKVIMTFVYDNQKCRRLAVLNVNQAGERGVANYNLCQQDEGNWLFVSDSEVTAN